MGRLVGGGVRGARAGFVQFDGGGGGQSRGAGLVLGMAAWRCFCLAGSGLARLLLVLLLHLPLLVEDLLGLPVADEQHHGGEDQDDGTPGATVAEAEAIGAGLAWTG